VKPLLAVVPDNRDPALEVAALRGDFWDRVRDWQAAGWSIGLQGYQHKYATRQSGLLGVNSHSEFAGVPPKTQAAKLDAALKIFSDEGVRADCWVAPGHSFDEETVRLLVERRISVISDGYFRRPVRWLGCAWVPQQLWRFRPMPGGVWTVCLHHNAYDGAQLDRLAADLRRYAGSITSLEAVLAGEISERTFADALLWRAWGLAIKVRRFTDRAGS
jgi:Uncharacterized protein conserved in bacteria (DUF2334)